jgi:5'-nucleotidase
MDRVRRADTRSGAGRTGGSPNLLKGKKLMSEIRLHERVVAESRAAPEHRIYVNRNLRMTSVQAIGFDLDHTLAHYRGPAVEELAYGLTSRRLVERFGYPEELLRIPYDRKFVIRGLVIDKRRGNILKMDYHNYVSRAYHGLQRLRTEARKAAYRTGRVRMSSDAYVTVDTLFHLPEVYLYVVLVGLRDKGKNGRKKRPYTRIYDDVREAIDSVHGDGSLKREILGNLEEYIRLDPRLGPTLEEFRRGGKKLFLLTNSEFYYTQALMRYLLHDPKAPEREWTSLFDLILTDAGKPAFFTNLELEWGEPRAEDAAAPGLVFHAGSARRLEHKLGFSGDEILYFGDHTYGDILRSKKTLGWRTAMVVEELKREMEVTRSVRPQIDELDHWKSLRGVLESDTSALELDLRRLERKLEEAGKNGDTSAKLQRRLERTKERLEERQGELAQVQRTTEDLAKAVDQRYNPYWGPLFRENQETSRFGHQVKDFACLYMTRVSNFQLYNPNHYFRSAAERMPHELE